jgi:hypothetical protein
MSSARDLQIASLDSRARLSAWLGISIIAINCIGIVITLYVLFDLNDIMDQRSGAEMLDTVRNDYRRFEEMESEARERMERSRGIEDQLQLDDVEKQIMALSQTLTENEKTYQVFFRLLKVNIYHLTNFIPGSNSWYEIWSPEIDSAIERSRFRQRQLLEIQRFYELRDSASDQAA